MAINSSDFWTLMSVWCVRTIDRCFPALVLILFTVSAVAEIRVTDFGAVPDGHSDNTAAIRRALQYAADHNGTKLLFPCGTGNTYLIRGPLTFPSFTTIEGDNAFGCRIFYDPSSGSAPVDVAFSLVGSRGIVIKSLMLQTGSQSPPKTIVALGGIPGAAGQNTFDTMAIKGYASQALGYSIASEVNTWTNVYWEYNGGGAIYGLYTSGKDDFKICDACTEASNLSLFLSGNTFTIFGANAFAAIADKVGGGTGDHYYRDSYIGLNKNAGSVGLEFLSGDGNQGGPNSAVHVENIRIENGGFGLYLKKTDQATVYHINVESVTWASGSGNPGYFVYSEPGLSLANSHFSQNIANNRGTTGEASVDGLEHCNFDEDYGPIAVRRIAVGNSFIVRGATSLKLPKNASKNVINGSLFTGSP